MINPRKAIVQKLALLGLGFSSACVFAQTPIWSEEFNGPAIDKTVWSYTTGGSGNGNGELQYYTADSSNAYIENGSLILQAKREAFSGKQFTSARISTNGRMAFKYGTLEARIKLPNLANGIWPAFWLMGNNFGIDGWPKCGEWDILEAGFKSAQTDGTVNKNVSSAMHWWHEAGTWGTWLQADSAKNLVTPTNLTDDYHLYKLDWTPSKVTFYVDNAQIFAMDITDPNMSEFRDNPAYIILNLAVGGSNFVEITDPALITAPFPAKMAVDYVRLYGNANTVVSLPGKKENLPSGNFGIMTETTPTLFDLNWGDRTNLYIWNNMTAVATVPSEGSSALAYQIKAGDWWGMGLLHKDYNMRNYAHGYLHFDVKTTSTVNMTVTVGSTAAGSGAVDLVDGGDQYGLVRDGAWHHVAIPLSKFGNVDFETIKTFFSVSGPAPAVDSVVAFDNLYFSESIKLAAPEQGNFGIYTENAAHKNAGEFGFGVNGDLFLWANTLTLQAGNILEGNASLNLKSTGQGWYGMGLTAREGFNLTAFDNANAALHFSMKTTDTVPFQIGFKSGNVNDIGQKWINFVAGSDPYGFARDGQWHEIVIPISTLAKDIDLFDVRQLLQVLGTTEINSLAIDDVYISGGLLAKDPGTNGTVVNRAPTAVLQPSVMGGTGPLSVVLDASKSNDVNGDALTYSWDFGDGTTGTGAKPTHVFTQGGSYNVTLTVSDSKLTSVAKTIIFVDDNFGKAKSSKRGVGYGNHSVEDLSIMSKGISWWYNWGIKPDLAVQDVYKNYGVEYVPMTWNGGYDEAAIRAYIASHPDVKYLLAFNEPQFKDQANMTPTEVAAQWPKVEKIANDYGLKIVSVALNFCGNCVADPAGNPYYTPWTYLEDFIKICPSCRIDAISIHAYMPDVGGIQWYVNQFKKFGKPIWLTEFCAWEANTTVETQQRMLTQVVDYLENDKDVARYAWFIGRSNGHPYNSLLDYRQSGVLTDLGDIYLNLPVHGDATNVHTLPKLVEAERYATINAPRTEETFSHTYGIRVEQTKDATGFLNLSDIRAGDWVEYNVVSTATTYNIATRVAAVSPASINVLVDGVQKATINVPATGDLQSWTTVNGTLALTAGSHKVRLVFTQAANLNWINFTTGTPPASSSSSKSSASSVVSSSVASSSIKSSASSVASSSIASSSIKSSASSVVSSSSKSSVSSVASSSVKSSSSSVASSSSVKSSSSSSVITYLPNTNMALNRPATASSNEGDMWAATFAVDGNSNTRWASQATDAQWISVDLGTVASFNKVVLNWEAAYGKSYEIQTSTDGTTWTKVYSTTTAVGGKETLNVSGSGRYVRVFGIARGTGYGYSLWDFEVWSPATGVSSSASSKSSVSSASVVSSVASSSKSSVSSASVASSSKSSVGSSSSVAAGTNLALNRPAAASTKEGDNTDAKFAFDGSADTRWASAFSDAQWISVDLGASYDLNKVVLKWEGAYGKSYEIQVSADNVTWTKAYGTTTGAGGTETLTVAGTGRYVRLNGTLRGTGYGYSLWEFEVYGTPAVVGNKALGKPAFASSNEGDGLAATFAVDGNSNSRWASQATDAQWIYVDLGAVRSITSVNLLWEAAYGKAYNVQVSNDAVTWTTVQSITNGDGGADNIPVSASGRYVRIQGVTRGTGYGYSLWNFEVY